MFESIAYEKQVMIKSEIAENIIMNGNKEDIEHIVSTLTDNAIKHTEAKKEIVVILKKEKNEIVLEVKIENKKKKALELMKNVGLSEEKAQRKILKLSGGEQQRIAIARSLSYNPKIIIADEPTGNLDKDTENEILKIFKTLAKKENKCIIIVTHSQNVCNEVDNVYELVNKE